MTKSLYAEHLENARMLIDSCRIDLTEPDRSMVEMDRQRLEHAVAQLFVRPEGTLLATEGGLTPTGQHIADCERDAARYRFIRDPVNTHHRVWEALMEIDCSGERMDRAIDDYLSLPQEGLSK